VRNEDKRAVKIILQLCIRPYLSICGAARGTSFNGERGIKDKKEIEKSMSHEM
jgi:hypothetical protein